MDDLKCLHNYDLDCVAINDETGKELFSFKASEYNQKELGGGYVAGGIASANQKYTIKTNDARVKDLKPYVSGIQVEGIKYALVFLKGRKNDLPWLKPYQRNKNKEYILELE